MGSQRPPHPAAATVLIVEDDVPLARLFTSIVQKGGHTVTAVHTLAEGKARVDAGGVHLLFTDVRLPDGEGLELIEHARRVDPQMAIIAVTAFGTIELAVRAVRLGAYDFLTKPVEPAVMTVAMDRAIEARRLRAEVEELRGALAAESASREIVGRSRALADITSLVRRVADGPATVLITGPTGSGKELVARALHDGSSRRRSGRFVAVNAAAIPENLLESELFGYVRGAFTDARTDRRGLFAEADGGTLFLDEIGDLKLPLQAKILRALQEREIRPVGATKSLAVDVRVVAATHRDLREAVRDGRFREDLFYRIAVIEIAIPPLRERVEDILPLAEHFLARVGARAGRTFRGFSAAAAARLVAYGWPGNVRELENAVERAVALAAGDFIGEDDLPQTLKKPVAPTLFESAAERMLTLDQLQVGYVKHVLERFGGNKVRAAAALGISRRTIQRWLGEKDPDDPVGDPSEP